MSQIPDAGRRDPGDIMTIAFGTTVAMWAIGYLCRLPGASVAPWILSALLIAFLILGGVAAGRYSFRGVRGGVYSGLICGLVNLLVLGALLFNPETNRIVPSAAWWLPGSLVLCMICGALGAILGGLAPHPRREQLCWPALLAIVAAVATLFLLSVGGAVTGFKAGLAVPDWPNTEGYAMFLYPLSRMTGGIYFEHSHRLIGSLVGLTTLVLGIYVQFVEKRKSVRMLAVIAIVAVIVQGIMGGLRVTGDFTLSTQAADMRPSTTLAIVHGVFAQVFLALLVALIAVLSTTWKAPTPPKPSHSAATDRILTPILVGALFVQLILGALVRHQVPTTLQIHIGAAAVMMLLSVLVGVRAWGLHEGLPVLPKVGTTLMVLIGIQLMLGVAALIATQSADPQKDPTAIEVAVSTLHQVGGALLLAAAVALAAWTRRLLTPSQTERVEPRTARGGLVES